MAREAPVEVEGVVRELLPRQLVRIALDDGHTVVAHLAGGPRRNYVRVIVGDRVRVHLSPNDLGRGRIVRKLGPSRD